jgi:hypothetical protein
MNDQRHHLTQAQLASPPADFGATGQLQVFPSGLEGLAEIIDMAEQFD